MLWTNPAHFLTRYLRPPRPLDGPHQYFTSTQSYTRFLSIFVVLEPTLTHHRLSRRCINYPNHSVCGRTNQPESRKRETVFVSSGSPSVDFLTRKAEKRKWLTEQYPKCSTQWRAGRSGIRADARGAAASRGPFGPANHGAACFSGSCGRFVATRPHIISWPTIKHL